MDNMTPITPGQIGKICELMAARLRESWLLRESVQLVLETVDDQLSKELVAIVRKRVETVSNLVVRRVCVNRSRSPQQALDATGWRQHTHREVVAAMPGRDGGIEEVDVYFFRVGRRISDADLDKKYDLPHFRPADPYSLAAVNETDPAFADEHPNGTHWQDASGRWCYAAFDRWDGERRVRVYRCANDWRVGWWLAGLRNPQVVPSST